MLTRHRWPPNLRLASTAITHVWNSCLCWQPFFPNWCWTHLAFSLGQKSPTVCTDYSLVIRISSVDSRASGKKRFHGYCWHISPIISLYAYKILTLSNLLGKLSAKKDPLFHFRPISKRYSSTGQRTMPRNLDEFKTCPKDLDSIEVKNRTEFMLHHVR